MWSGFRRSDRRRRRGRRISVPPAGSANFCTAGIAGRRRIQRTLARQQAFGEFKGRRRDRRGASSPANPCSFVRKHHAPEANFAAGATGVVPHTPQTLISSSRGTTPSTQMTQPAGGAPTASSSPQDRAGPLRGSSADAAGTIRGNEIGLWMTADTFCQLSQSP